MYSSWHVDYCSYNRFKPLNLYITRTNTYFYVSIYVPVVHMCKTYALGTEIEMSATYGFLSRKN